MSEFWSGALAAILGSIIASWTSYFFQEDIAKKTQKSQIDAFLNGIKSEIINLWKRYYDSVGKKIEELPDGQGLDAYYPIYSNYFIVYEKNATLIGHLNKDLVDAIIKTDLSIKGMKDSLLMNNELINKIHYYEDISIQTESEYHKKKFHLFNNIFQSYGTDLKDMHFRLEENKDELITRINNFLSYDIS